LDLVGDKKLSQRLPKALKSLKADDVIAARSAVPAVSLRKRPGDKTTDGILPAKRQRTDYVPVKELKRLRKVADGHHSTTVVVYDASYDFWGAVPEPPKNAPVDEGKFLPKVKAPKAPKTIAQQPISLASNGKLVPAVPKPKGGFSYNPDYTEYETRYLEVSDKVVDAERKRLDANEAERLKLEGAVRSAAEAEAAEARADLSEWEEESAWEGIESGGEELSVRAKRPERKTEERKTKHDAAMKRRDAQAQRIKAIAREVAEKDHAMALEKVEMSDDSMEGDDEDLRRRQLGKFRLPEKDLELVLPDELQDSLRLLKPEGNLLKDRYRNLLVRGKMESRRRIPFRKQAKKKVTEKWTHKDFELF